MNESQNEENNPWLTTRTRTGAEYDAPYEAKSRAGIDVHGEANLVEKLLQQYHASRLPQALGVLDAGCGTGRMGIELNRRGYQVTGVDLDEVMLSQARAKAPEMRWVRDSLATVQLGQTFDAIVMAGNVMIFVTPGTEIAVLSNLVSHLKPNGLLLAAFQLNSRPWTDISADSYEAMAQAAGLTTLSRWSTWDQDPWRSDDSYVVSLHQKLP